MNFLLLIRLFNDAELERIKAVAKELRYVITVNEPSIEWQIHGLNPKDRPEVEAFFSLAEVEIS